MNRVFKIIVLIILCITFITSSSYAADVTLAWDRNESPFVIGYKIYYGTESGIYGLPIDTGNDTLITIPNFFEGGKYYYAATAYSLNNESDYSKEISYIIPLGPPTGIRLIIIN